MTTTGKQRSKRETRSIRASWSVWGRWAPSLPSVDSTWPLETHESTTCFRPTLYYSAPVKQHSVSRFNELITDDLSFVTAWALACTFNFSDTALCKTRKLGLLRGQQLTKI